MRIQHNIAALNSYRNLSGNNNQVAKNLEKLSSGYKINRAGDDAAGLAISEKMRSQISGLNMAIKNANDGISLIQTAEGALTEVHSMLQRANELAVQSANGVNSESERESIQNEFLELTKEIDRIADGTNFNKINLLDGSLKSRLNGAPSVNGNNIVVTFLQEGVEDLEDSSGGGESVTKIVTGTDESGEPGKKAGVKVSTEFKNDLANNIIPNAVNGIVGALSGTFGELTGQNIGIGLDFMNNPNDDLLAYVSLGAQSTGGEVSLTYNLTINIGNKGYAGLFDQATNGKELADETRNQLEATLIHEMTHALMDEIHTAGMLGVNGNFESVPAFPKWFSEGVAQAMGGGGDWVRSPQIGITGSTSTSQITSILSGSNTSLESGSIPSQYATGYLAVMYLGHLIGNKAEVNSVATFDNQADAIKAANITKGIDQLLTKVKEGFSLDQAIDELTKGSDRHFTGIEDFEDNFAKDGAQFVKDLMTVVDDGRGALVSDGNDNAKLKDKDLIANAGENAKNAAFQLNTKATHVKNTYDPSRNVIKGGTATRAGRNAKGDQAGGAVDRLAAEARLKEGKGLTLQIGDTTNQKIILNIGDMHSEALKIDKVDLSTEAGAGAGVDTIKAAIDTVSKQRGALGAMQNRLEHTINNLSNAHENMTAAESRIRDVDMADEMMKYTKNNILVQAAQAMLAQANQVPQGVLQLLQ